MTPKTRKILIISVTALEIALMVLSWMANFGPLRLILSRIAYPVFSALLFLIANLRSVKYAEYSRPLRILTAVSCAVYMLPHLLISERIGGEEYLFFGLIRTESVPAVFPTIGYASLLLSTAAVVAQIFFCVLERKKRK